MDTPLAENPWMRRSRYLSQALMLSGALNLCFLVSFIVLVAKKERPVRIESGLVSEEVHQHAYISGDGVEVLSGYFNAPYEELLLELNNKCLVEDGYAKRDYALACLVAFHYFDIKKALAGVILQTRYLEVVHREGGERVELEVFPGLQDTHFEALYGFAKVEKWPFTAQGLYVNLQRMRRHHHIDPSLKEAFYLTAHFHYLWRLFNRIEKKVGVDELLDVVLELEWDTLDRWHREFCLTQDLGENVKRHCLMELLALKSPFAARRFLEDDREFALTKLDDASVLYLLNQIDSNTPKGVEFVRRVLTSVRSDEVLQAAGCKLYALAQENPPSPYSHEKVLRSFGLLEKVEEENFPRQETMAVINAHRKHLVVKGDSLWKLARDYHVPLEKLMYV
ncbi:MAG: LysM peptidoglycan-binding domain-containing protein, partial [Chlamydiae bacterium]|nr:LysM peptidoglycan-binding domain-containing protein [Chlamydiota bacterium]